MGNDLFKRITSQRGAWGNLLTRIPGLRDANEEYLNMGAQRDADRIVREHVAGQLNQLIDRMARVENTILDNGGLSYMSKTRTVKSQLQTLADKIGTAAPGYSFSGPLKIREHELDQIYAFDEALLRYVEQIGGALDGLQQAASGQEGVDDAIATLQNVIVEADEAFDLRKNLINRVGNGDADLSDLSNSL